MVYVDSFNAPFGRMRMCHMIADTSEELFAMARTIGVERRWIQNPGTPREHFDVCLAKKALAIKAGAKEVSVRDIVKITMARKSNAGK